ncbi:DUF4097 family beta strand repeat-containing protein [Pseudofrankia inefficax]|uniref:DUF4097 domain-containing protein n=1 Tax=Pseudofrankia inefficax (strain DSM 45817 / CECT 9037 / DDB 130130 / EuI1c) TaxID=298654 RepID=E3IW31_PSEI1|nr:DUF4097 family beta strand repeat-containing protein [Pseudofrankia inefficax]ADP84959.1 hypothetical protein FraEuI1c_6992 [Pseudofrankia inefficax]
MPIFDTPAPILATLELFCGSARIIATDRVDTVVEVRPTDPDDDSDVEAAKQTRVEYADGALLVRAPRARTLAFSRRTRSVDVTIELPATSQVDFEASVADVTSSGELGECRVKTTMGTIRLEHCGSVRLSSGAGPITVDRVAGDADVKTGTGAVRIGAVDGDAEVRNSNGATRVGAVTGEVRVRNSNGEIVIDRAVAGVDARTANGAIQVGGVVSGAVSLRTAAGNLEVGIAAGTAAWLDVHTAHGLVRNELDNVTEEPGEAEHKVEVRAQTSFGDIRVHRA